MIDHIIMLWNNIKINFNEKEVLLIMQSFHFILFIVFMIYKKLCV